MEVQTDVALSAYTTLGLGGPADRLVTAYDEAEVVAAVREATGPVLVLGGGSNLVVADAGFRGTVVRIASLGRTVSELGDGVRLDVAAGESWDDLVSSCVADSLAGVECLAGIPGLVGATPIQNVGAYGQDVSETVVSVRAYDRQVEEICDIQDSAFGYRSSRFKRESPRWVVLRVSYQLTRSAVSRPVRYGELASALGIDVGATAPLAEVRAAVLSLRRSKGMVLDPQDADTRSAGSFFTNPLLLPAQLEALRARGVEPPSYPERDGRLKVPAAWLIEQAGFAKGDFAGPSGISSKHALALVNRGGACTDDVLRVARTIRDDVRARFGVELVPEPVLVGVAL